MKKTISILIMLFGMVFMIGCRGQQSNDEGKIILKYWNSLTGTDGDIMRQLVKQFNDEHKNDEIEVVETFTQEQDHYTNLELLIPRKKGPDVAIIHSHRVQSYANSGLIQKLEPLMESTNITFNSEDYIKDVFDSLYYKQGLYAVPLDVHPIGLFYNKTLLEKYNLTLPTNRAELIAVSKEIQSKEAEVSGLPLSIVWPSELIWTTSLYQNGGLEIKTDLSPGYATPEGVAALKSFADLIHVEGISPKNLSVDQDLFMFQAGKALFHIQGSWMLRGMVESGINFGVMPLSGLLGDNETTKDQIAVRSHTFVVPDSGSDISEVRQKAIMKFIKYMTENAGIWATAGQIPASNIARDTEEYKSL
ncbi:MAG: extracellular solute-binding protein, partial [Acholeplasmataceae bacterium]